jgi:hypothetical protein
MQGVPGKQLLFIYIAQLNIYVGINGTFLQDTPHLSSYN